MTEKKAKKSLRKRTPLTRDRVLARATKIADKGGIGALSMRKLAQELKVEAMSLYNHVQNKEDILAAIVDTVIGEIEVPIIGDDWRSAMRRRASSAHEVLLRHPWAAMQLMSRINIGPSALRYVDATLGTLREGGFSFVLADHAWNTLDSYIYGFTLQRLNFPFEPDENAAVAEEYQPQLPADLYPHLTGLSAEVMEGRYDGVHELSFGLELILDGLENLRLQDRAGD